MTEERQPTRFTVYRCPECGEVCSVESYRALGERWSCAEHVRKQLLEYVEVVPAADLDAAEKGRDYYSEQLANVTLRLDKAKAALREIRDKYGRVCPEFELCTHESCRSSYSAWHVADAALKALDGLREPA